MSKWTKVYTLEGVTDFYADDDFEDALREVFGEEPDLSVKVRITVENGDEAAAKLSALRERVEALEAIRELAVEADEYDYKHNPTRHITLQKLFDAIKETKVRP